MSVKYIVYPRLHNHHTTHCTRHWAVVDRLILMIDCSLYQWSARWRSRLGLTSGMIRWWYRLINSKSCMLPSQIRGIETSLIKHKKLQRKINRENNPCRLGLHCNIRSGNRTGLFSKEKICNRIDRHTGTDRNTFHSYGSQVPTQTMTIINKYACRLCI